MSSEPLLLHSSHIRHATPPTMWIFPLIGYLGVVLGFVFLTLAIGMSAAPTRRVYV